MLIKNCKIIYKDEIELGSVLIENNKITKINPSKVNDDVVIDGGGLYLSPGFIDIHIHGAGGFDTMDGTYDAINNISKTIITHGTTSFLPTTMTCSDTDIKKAVEAITEAINRGTEGAKVLGAHLEGPFISTEMIGAQNPKYIQAPSIDSFKKLVGENKNTIISITLAPEVPGALELIEYLNKEDIIASIGHSKATHEEAIKGIASGVSHSTHLFNAMSGFHHREAGVVGAIFNSDITTEVICDGIHISYPSLKIAFNQKTTDKVILISDAMMACGMPEGTYSLGGQEVFVKDNAARLENGALAGSILTLDKAVRNLHKNTHFELPEIIKMATYNPAKLCKLQHKKGLIKEGYDADLILFDENINVKKVMVGGRFL